MKEKSGKFIPTCSARSPLYGVILNDGVLVAQADNDLHLDIGFSNGTERKEQCVEPAKDDATTMPNVTTKQMADFTHFICNKLDALKELFKRKNQQYSVGTDPLANFPGPERYCVPVMIAMLRCTRKLKTTAASM